MKIAHNDEIDEVSIRKLKCCIQSSKFQDVFAGRALAFSRFLRFVAKPMRNNLK